MDENVLIVLAALVFLAAVLALEVFLAKKGRRPGLVLPFLSLGISAAVFVGKLVIEAMKDSVVNHFTVYAPDGTVIPEPLIPNLFGITAHDFAQALLWFLILNIFTAALFAAYAICRGRQRKRQALEQMRMQDL